MTTPALLLFDLGGVIVDYSGGREIVPLFSREVSEEERRNLWNVTDAGVLFECGQITPQEFAERVCRDWPLKVGPEEFLEQFAGWTRGLFPGVTELLSSLRPSFRLAALSNCNELTWRIYREKLGIDALFELAISSHQLGIRKPAPEIYDATISRLGVSAENVAFFDDAQRNIDAALALGMQAHRVRGVEELTACLQNLGYLD